MEANLAVTIPRRWLTIPLAAVYLSCPVRTIRAMIWTGELKRARIGKRFLVDVADLDALVSKRMSREIDPDKPAIISGRKRARTLKTLYPCGSQRGTGDAVSTVPVLTEP